MIEGDVVEIDIDRDATAGATLKGVDSKLTLKTTTMEPPSLVLHRGLRLKTGALK